MENIDRDEVINEDRLSALPDHLRHKILSHLPVHAAAATTLLSRSWKDVWLTIPCLRLDSDFCYKIINDDPALLLDSIDQIFSTRSKKCLDHYSKMLNVLKLRIPSWELVERYKISKATIAWLANKLIVCAINEFQVQELDFSLGCLPMDVNLSINTLGSWKQAKLTHLTLSNCVIGSGGIEITIPTLKSLSLERVMLHQQVLDSFVANCNLIESLKLLCCTGEFYILKASCLKKLVTINIYNKSDLIKEIEIDAPNLKYFRYHGSDPPRACIIHDLASSKGLKILSLTNNPTISDTWLNRINVAQLYRLTQLELCGCKKLKCVKILSGSLTTLCLSSHELEKLEIIDAPRLRKMCYFGNPIPSFILNDANALAMTKTDLFLSIEREKNIIDDNLHHENVFKFLSLFDGIVRRLEVHFTKKFVVPPNMRRRLSSPLLAIKHMSLTYNPSFPSQDDEFRDVVDTLLWLSPRPEKLVTMFRHRHSIIPEVKIFEFKYKKENADSLKRCEYCKDLEVRCWRHCLAKVLIKNKRRDKSSITVQHDTELIEYFKNATKSKNLIVKIIYE